MNILKKITLLLGLTFVISCSVEPYEGTINVPNNPQTPSSAAPLYAMTAEINGVPFKANTPFGNNLFSSYTIYNYFPSSDFILLQGRQGGIVGNPEINIWLKKSLIAVGTYPIGTETHNTPPGHFIDLIDNSRSDFQYTKDGTITITDVNTTTKIIKGTFAFRTTPSTDPSDPINCTITKGTFNYKFMN